MAQIAELMQANELVEGMTISQRLDTALHPMTAKTRCIEDIDGNEVTYFFDDCEHWTFTAIVSVEDGRYGFISTLKELHFNDEPIECSGSHKRAIEQLVADEYSCTQGNDEYEPDWYDQRTYGLSNSDFIYG